MLGTTPQRRQPPTLFVGRPIEKRSGRSRPTEHLPTSAPGLSHSQGARVAISTRSESRKPVEFVQLLQLVRRDLHTRAQAFCTARPPRVAEVRDSSQPRPERAAADWAGEGPAYVQARLATLIMHNACMHG